MGIRSIKPNVVVKGLTMGINPRSKANGRHHWQCTMAKGSSMECAYKSYRATRPTTTRISLSATRPTDKGSMSATRIDRWIDRRSSCKASVQASTDNKEVGRPPFVTRRGAQSESCYSSFFRHLYCLSDRSIDRSITTVV